MVSPGHNEVYTCYDHNDSNIGRMGNNIQNSFFKCHIASHFNEEVFSIDIFAFIHFFAYYPYIASYLSSLVPFLYTLK